MIAACVAALPQLEGIVEAAPDASFRIRGQKLARSPIRYSGRTAMRADISVHEPRQPQDIDTPFAFSMEGNNSPLADRQQIPFARAPGWNSPQAWNKFRAEVGGKLRFGDPGIRLIEEAGRERSVTLILYLPPLPPTAKTGRLPLTIICLVVKRCLSVQMSSSSACQHLM